jgi:hypothetical protein
LNVVKPISTVHCRSAMDALMFRFARSVLQYKAPMDISNRK